MKRLTFLVLFLAGCADSPLLNHKNEADPGRPRPTEEAGKCVSYLNPTNSCVQVSWIAGPSSSGASAFNLDLRSLDVEWSNAQLEVTLWMPDHGHGSAPVEMTMQEPGFFRVEEVYFLMPGLWEVRIAVKDFRFQNYTSSFSVKL